MAKKKPATPKGRKNTPQMGRSGEGEGAGNELVSDTTEMDANGGSDDAGNDLVSAVEVAAVSLDNGTEGSLSSRAERLPGESRNGCWERLRKMARASGMPRGQGPGTAYYWADEQISRIFAKPPEPEPDPIEPDPEPDPEPVEVIPAEIPVAPAPQPDDGVSGLGTLPDAWGDLSANASLQAEIAWVSANRLRVRDGTGVDLSRALSPAPSYAALSWLETSILFPSKFADISVKATANQDEEKEHIRREKLAIEEVRGILAEMLADGDVPQTKV